MQIMKVRVLHMGRLQGKIKGLENKIKRGVVESLLQLRGPIETAAKQRVLSGPKTGRIVARYNPYRLHQASAPGQSPASDRGRLVASIKTMVDPAQFNMVLSADARGVARHLEYGTRHMAARPFLRRTLGDFRERIVTTMQRVIKGML